MITVTQISSPSGLQNLSCKHKLNMQNMLTHIHQSRRAPLQPPVLCFLPLFSFLSLSPPPPTPSFIWPISRLAVTLSQHESKYRSIVDYSSRSPQAYHTAMDRNHEVQYLCGCILSSVWHLQLHSRLHQSMCYL